MSSALDLEEQEQLDQIKHFWKRWGNLISWALIAVLGAYAAWNGWQAWQNRQASQAAVLFDTVDQAAQRGDMTLLDRSLTDIQDKFGSTTLAHQAALLALRHHQALDHELTQHPQTVAQLGEGRFELVQGPCHALTVGCAGRQTMQMGLVASPDPLDEAGMAGQ